MEKSKKGRGGTKKYGRSLVKCARYKSQDRRFKNKVSQLSGRFKHYSSLDVLNGIEDKTLRSAVKARIS